MQVSIIYTLSFPAPPTAICHRHRKKEGWRDGNHQKKHGCSESEDHNHHCYLTATFELPPPNICPIIYSRKATNPTTKILVIKLKTIIHVSFPFVTRAFLSSFCIVKIVQKNICTIFDALINSGKKDYDTE